jgi:hypothetical protein
MRLSVKRRRHPRVSVRLSIFLALSLCFRIGWPSQKVKASSSLLSPWLNADSAVSAAYSDGSFKSPRTAKIFTTRPTHFITSISLSPEMGKL